MARRKIFVQGDVSNDRPLIGDDVDDRSLIGGIREYGSKISCGWDGEGTTDAEDERTLFGRLGRSIASLI